MIKSELFIFAKLLLLNVSPCPVLIFAIVSVSIINAPPQPAAAAGRYLLSMWPSDTAGLLLPTPALLLLGIIVIIIVKLRQGSGKDRQGMASKAKGLKA